MYQWWKESLTSWEHYAPELLPIIELITHKIELGRLNKGFEIISVFDVDVFCYTTIVWEFWSNNAC